MPKVPYNPVPESTPGGAAIPAVHINAPVEAFGGASAAGLGQVGSEVSKFGDMIFQRALDLQKLNNEASAREADAKYMMKAGALHAEYGSLAGKAAVDAYPQYMKDLQDSRKAIRDGLPNDYTRKLYDAPSLSTMGRTIFNGAGHAATENKKYAIGASGARIEASGEQAFMLPNDDVAFQKGVNAVKSETVNQAPLAGWGPEQTDKAIAHNVSGMWTKRIIGLSRTAPFDAAAMLEKNRGSMVEADFLRADNAVRSQSRAVGSVNIANEVFVEGMETPTKPQTSLADMEEETRKRAEAKDPNDPVLVQHAVSALRGRYNQSEYAKRQEKLTNEQTIAEGIKSGVKDIQQLRTDPKVAAAIDALPPKQQLAIPKQINSYNASVNKTTNEENDIRLLGMSNNDVEGFLNTDVTQEPLSQERMRYYMEKQRKLKELPNADPRVNRAVSNIRTAFGTQLESLGVYKRTDGNKADYDRFTGAVQSAIDVWQETHGKAATYKDVTETIGPQVIRKITEPGWIWGTNDVPFFKQTVPSKFTDEYKSFKTNAGEIEPTPEQTQKAYIRMQFMKLYGNKKEPK